MTPQEKFKRMNCPQSLEDFNITMTLEELSQCEEAKEWVDSFKRRLTDEVNELMERDDRKLGTKKQLE